MAKDQDDNEKGQIPTNLRLLYVLEEIARAGRPVLPASLGESLDLPKPTIHRLLQTAEAEGFLQRDVDGRSYGPGRRMRLLASNTLSSERVRSERLRVMKALAQEVGETCNLSAPGRDGMVYLDRVETHWPLRIQLPIGTLVPFHCTASGKMYLSSLRTEKLGRLLASLPLEPETDRTEVDQDKLMQEARQTRSNGYATDDQEFMEGMAAIAVPIKDDHARLLSTLSIHAPVQRHDVESLLQFLPQLQLAAQRLEDLALG